MRNVWLVSKHAVKTTLKQRSFWILAFLMPVMLLAINVFAVIQDNDLARPSNDAAAAASEADSTTDDEMPPIGLVDEAGLIAEMPPDFPQNVFLPFPGEGPARAALEAGDIEQYVFIPADYIATGDIAVYDREFQIMRGGGDVGVAFDGTNAGTLQYLIDYNLVEDEVLLAALGNPIPGSLAERHVLNPPQENQQGDQATAEVVVSVMPYIFYFLLLMGSSYLMRSVVAEKENRTVEVLLVSLRPREVMFGKILGLGVVIVIQLAIWLIGGWLVMNRGQAMFDLSAFTVSPDFFLWTTLFLLLGYLLYGSVMAAAGAIANNSREGGQMTWILIIPLMPTLMFSREFLENPDGTLAVVLSLFPFSAPSAMVTRLAVAEVPLWQVLLSLAGLAVTAYLFIVLAARFFRPQNLLSGVGFKWRRLATGWRS